MGNKSDLMRFTAIDFNIVVAILLLGIELCWATLFHYTCNYAPIGINETMANVVVSTLGATSIVLALFSIRRCSLRFSLLVLFLAIMVFVTSVTPLITGKDTKEVAVGCFIIFFCTLAFLKNREMYMFVGTAMFLVTEIMLWTGIGDRVTVMILGDGISGTIFVYYACGLILYNDLGKDYLRVISKSLSADTQNLGPGDVFESVNNFVLGLLMFITGIYLIEKNINVTSSVPVIVLSSIMIVVSFYGMVKGKIPEGTLSLIASIYLLCLSVVVYLTGSANESLFSFILIIPMLVLIVIFIRRKYLTYLASAIILTAYFVAVSFFEYSPNMSAMLILIALLQLYSSICRLVFVEFGVRLPLNRYV